MGYKPTHDFQSCALHEQVFANCRSIGEVVGVKVGSEGKRSVTKTPLHELHGFAAEWRKPWRVTGGRESRCVTL